MTEKEHTDIKAARVNGVGLATDKDQIEDQQVLIWHKQDVDGKPITGAYLKVRADAAKALNDQVVKASGEQPTLVSTADVSSRIITAIKGITVQAKHGDPLRAKDVARIQSALAALDQVTADLDGVIRQHPGTQAAKDAELTKVQLSAWSAAFQALKGAEVGDVASPVNGGAQFHSDHLIAEIKAPRKPNTKEKNAGIQWKKTRNDYTLSDLDKARQRDQSATYSMNGHHYLAEIDGATVRYWPDTDGIRFALRGRLQIDARGQDAGASARAFAILDELGIDSSRASAADQEALYLQRIAYRYKVDRGMNAAASATAERRAWLEQTLGVSLSGAHYRPNGDHQAFSHGRRQQFDPVLQADPQWAQFQRDYRLFHRVTHGDFAENIGRILNGGAQMAPTADKMRRGLPLGGMSPDQDLNTGGAQYLFTRLFTVTKAEQAGVGIVWRASRLARLDAISYSGDKFGETRGEHVRIHGRKGIGELKQVATRQTNETIFKDSLSLFDDLDSIRAGSQRQEVIQLFKAAGYSEWPDGRSLEEVIKL